MSDEPRPSAVSSEPTSARVRPARVALVWLVPAVAALIAGYLVWRDWVQHGAQITITFATANGLVAGQTQVSHKAVALGTVEDIQLSKDLSNVIVHVRISRDATPILTDHARFWVVRPRLTTRAVSGLETLVSGAYIEVDPGPPGGQPQTEFKGLEEPPGVRSDEPGHTYVLTTDRIGSLGPGSPVLYRNANVGEVLAYKLGPETEPVTINIFVRAPFDRYVHPSTRFWKETGLTIGYGAQGLHVELDSLQAALAGGIAFSTPRAAADSPPASSDTGFPLYADQTQAIEAGYVERIPFVAYFQSSVQGLGPGSPVQLFGIQIGVVTAVKPQFKADGPPQVRVDMEVQPDRVFTRADIAARDPVEVIQHLVESGMRAELSTLSFITGQESVSFTFSPGAAPAQVSREGPAIVVPSRPGAGLADAVGAIAQTLSRLPLEQIADNLNRVLVSADQTIGSPEMRTAIRSLSATLQELQTLTRETNAGLTPALKRLPAIADQLQQAVTQANQVLGGLSGGFGAQSDFHRDLQQLMAQASDAARSIRLLADFLDRHPEALLRGRGAGP